MKILIADDHAIVRKGLIELLREAYEALVVLEAVNSQQAIELATREEPDVILLDISMPGRSGLDVLHDIRRDFPRTAVLVVTTHDAIQYAVRCLRAGAGGYVAKSAGGDEVVAAVREVYKSGRYISPDVASALADLALMRPAGRPPHEQLSDREHDVLRRLAAGRTVSEIAADLSLSVKTVSTYRTRMIEKLGLRTTADLVRYALEHKLFE